MHLPSSSSLPPLPSSLSSRLLSTINPQTGACKHHPAVQLCELVEHNTRWVVKRKICSKCGARAPVGVSRRMPGVSVVNPSSSKDKDPGHRTTSQSPQPRRQSSSTKSRGRSRSASSTDRLRERSASSSRTKGGGHDITVITSKSDCVGEGRQRTNSTTSRRKSICNNDTSTKEDHSHRRSRSASTSRQRSLIEAALSSAKAEASAERCYPSGGGASRHRRPSKNDDNYAGALAVGSPNNCVEVVPTFHTRALEFTSKVLTTTAEPLASPPPMEADQGISEEVDKFDESDPYIIIPVINRNDDSLPPPPPPRSPEEMERHMERLKLRHASLRREYQARRAKMSAVVTLSSKSSPAEATDPPAAAESTRRSKSMNQKRQLTKPDAKQCRVNHHRRSVTEVSEPVRRKVTSPPRSRRASSCGRGRHDKDYECKSSMPSSTALIAVTPTRVRSSSHRSSSREKITPTAGKEVAKSRSVFIEKPPRSNGSTEQSNRRVSSHEKNRPSRSKSIDHSNRSRSLQRTREVLHSGDEGHRSEEQSYSNRSRAYSRKSSKEGGRSTLTGSTKPESVSSASQSKSTIKIVLSRSTTNEVEEEKVDESPLIVFQRMKHAHRRQEGGKGQFKNDVEYDDSRSHRSQPMAHIHCSSDEQSHASSISESLFTNEDFDKKDRSLLLSLTKGGAKQLVTRSKSALGGIGSLNSARRKFQSALLV